MDLNTILLWLVDRAVVRLYLLSHVHNSGEHAEWVARVPPGMKEFFNPLHIHTDTNTHTFFMDMAQYKQFRLLENGYI